MSSSGFTVEDSDTCAACGDDIAPDGEGERRQRVVIEDLARSQGHVSGQKLCHPCWRDVQDFIGGDASALDE